MSEHLEEITGIRELLQRGEHQQATVRVAQAIEQAPDDANLASLEILCREAAGDLDGALTLAERLFQRFSGHPAIAFHAGRLALASGDAARASERLAAAVALDPNHAAARTLQARIERDSGDREAAIETLRTALRADPEHVPAMVALASLLLADGATEEAHQLAARAVSAEPEEVRAQLVMAQVFQAQGNEAFARQCLVNALERMPDEPRLKAALQRLTAVPSASSPPPSDGRRSGMDSSDRQSFEEATRLMQAGRLDEASELLAPLCTSTVFEQQHDARRLLADCRLAQGDSQAALAAVAPLCDDERLPLDTELFIARLMHSNDQSDQAIARLRRRLEQHSDSPGVVARVHNLIARILDEQGQAAAAIEHMDLGQWRPSMLVDELGRLCPESLHRAWLELQEWPADDPSPEVMPVLVGGWPGGGRELLLSALSASGELDVLAPDELPRRRHLLNLPARPDDVFQLDSSLVRRRTRRYLQGVQERAQVLEPGWFEPAALPALCRCFPGLTLVWPVVREEYLLLQWRLAGCREVGRMLEAWRAEQDLFQHLRDRLPLRIVEVELKALLDSPEATLEGLCNSLEIVMEPRMLQALEQMRVTLGQRPADHWRTYQALR